MTLFLCGDVMLGRGLDQVLPFPGDPALYESFMRSALGYIRLAQEANGPIPRPADFPYVWGDAIGELSRMGAQCRIINLETGITSMGSPWPGKEIHYRMHPGNAPCLASAGIDVCVLANNHMMDWGVPGLLETLDVLDAQGIKHAGAGRTLRQACAPAVMEIGGAVDRMSENRPAAGRVLVFGIGSETSGIPMEWAATPRRPGLNILETRADIPGEIRESLRSWRRKGDVAIASIHWGGNWGYAVPDWQIALAHRLVDEAGFDLVHGHSSHHIKAIEVFHGSLILYGSGDFLNDYEGISGYEEFRPDLSLMYFPDWNPVSGALTGMRMTPMRTRRFQKVKATRSDAGWMEALMNSEGKRFGTRVERGPDDILTLRWG